MSAEYIDPTRSPRSSRSTRRCDRKSLDHHTDAEVHCVSIGIVVALSRTLTYGGRAGRRFAHFAVGPV